MGAELPKQCLTHCSPSLFRFTFTGNEVRWAGLLEKDISPAVEQHPWSGESIPAILLCLHLKHLSVGFHRGDNFTSFRPTWLLLGPKRIPKKACLISPLFPSASFCSYRAGAPCSGPWRVTGSYAGGWITGCHWAACLRPGLDAVPQHTNSFHPALLWKVKLAKEGKTWIVTLQEYFLKAFLPQQNSSYHSHWSFQNTSERQG